MIKLCKARSLLYRRQILQQNIRWNVLDEIYKIYMLLHRSDLNISENFRQTCRIFRQNFAEFTPFRKKFIEFCSHFKDICRKFANTLENVGKIQS